MINASPDASADLVQQPGDQHAPVLTDRLLQVEADLLRRIGDIGQASVWGV